MIHIELKHTSHKGIIYSYITYCGDLLNRLNFDYYAVSENCPYILMNIIWNILQLKFIISLLHIKLIFNSILLIGIWNWNVFNWIMIASLVHCCANIITCCIHLADKIENELLSVTLAHETKIIIMCNKWNIYI